MDLAFISRHAPTIRQYELAQKADFNLIHVGDLDAFKVTPWKLDELATKYKAFAVVNPALALRLISRADYICVFENEMRAEEGERPTFYAKELHIWDIPFLCSTNIRPIYAG
jgi:hypothetical protein